MDSLGTPPDASTQTAMAALEGFLVNNPDLERLEADVSRLNVFEAMGVVRHELRHSNFLAMLVDPRQTHGLGSIFAKRLLQWVRRRPRPSSR
jgi:hypothetical protein